MQSSNRIIDAFFSLLRAGLWEQGVRLQSFEPLDFDALYKLAEQQSVVGLLAAGLEHVEDRKVEKRDALPFLKKVYSLENRNMLMNCFIGDAVTKMRTVGIVALLVKGQGIAQCYTRPQWRSPGDIDFLFDIDDFVKAKEYMTPLAVSIDSEKGKHLGITIDQWVVELHGNMSCGLSTKMDKVVQVVQDDIFRFNHMRVWKNGETNVLLPSPDNDVIFVFTHILKHFYKGGIGLRQICDWCRLLWVYRESINPSLLEHRLRCMGLITEWRTFAALAVNTLGMSVDAMPLYNPSVKWKRKAERIRVFVIKVGNFGKNRDMSYYHKYPFLARKIISMSRRFCDILQHASVFPLDSFLFFPKIMSNGIRSAIRGV